MQPTQVTTQADEALNFQQGFAVASGQDPDDYIEEARRKELIDREAFRITLIKKRADAISARASSGIETEWNEDEEHYQGIDDANRHLHSANQLTNRISKGAVMGDSGVNHVNASRSVVFLNITRAYVDAGSARVSDMLLPTDDRAWEIKPTPIPRLSHHQINKLMSLMGMTDPAEVQAQIEQHRASAKESATNMQTAVEDCLVESNWHGEVRHIIEDSARIGSGVLKGPFPVRRTARMTKRDPITQRMQFIKVSEIKPGSKRVDPWNFFPDGACGENIHNGSFTWEREFISTRQVKEMMEMDGYDIDELRKVLVDGPKSTGQGTESTFRQSEAEFEMWIFYGHCAAEHLRMYGVELEEEHEEKLPTMAILINDRLVKITLSPMESGEFPYDILAWQRRPGLPWGVGIARQIRTVQRMLNGSTRAMMDNGALSAAPQIVMGNGVTPEDGNTVLRPGKKWKLETDGNINDVRAAFTAFVVPSVQQPLMNIINFALKMAEDTTGMPAMLQGIRGDAPNTLGGMQMQNNNSTSVLRRLARRFDDYVTRPHIQRYFDWMMTYSDDESIKGDFQIDVRASSALLERDSQQQFMLNMVNAALNPKYGIDPSKLMQEIVKSQRLDPERFMLSEEERKASANEQPPQDPLLQVRAGLIEAQTQVQLEKVNEIKANTATKNVEGMFSATETAKNIYNVAPLAHAADAVWKSAGGEDKDLPPAIPEVQGIDLGMDPSADVPEPIQNTNPLTPANPTNPAVGMQRGIEGGGADSDYIQP